MTGEVRFLLGHEPRTLGDVDPNLTVLRYLRDHERRTGTKEGCAEGDCGACTVVLGELDGDRIRYRAVNACILVVPQLDGKQLITVEHLAGPDGALHPVQRAMVDCHGSQCGFCTPGFVMSLFALYKDPEPPSRPQVLDAIAGNLCRCTGYRPIVDAAEQMRAEGTNDHFSARAAETVAELGRLRRSDGLDYEAAGRRFMAPRTLAELAARCGEHPDACLLAGGTDVGLWITKQHRDLDPLIYVGEVAELQRIEEGARDLEIGAGVTYTDAHAAIGRHWPDFGELIRRLGSVQIRNSGTIGGNIANGSPIGDTMPALIVLAAELRLRQGAIGRCLPLEDFFVDYRQTALASGEFVEWVRIPLPRSGQQFRCYKISKRFDQDISAVMAAFNVELDGDRVRAIRVAYGGMAAIPKRAHACEQALVGRPWTEATIERGRAALAEDFAPIGDMRASRDYRLLAAQNLLTKFHIEISAAPPPSRVLALEAVTHG